MVLYLGNEEVAQMQDKYYPDIFFILVVIVHFILPSENAPIPLLSEMYGYRCRLSVHMH